MSFGPIRIVVRHTANVPEVGDIVDFVDIDMSTRRANPARVAAVRFKNGELSTLAVFLPGRKYWSSLGSPFSYAAAEYKVFTVLKHVPGISGDYTVEELIDIPARMSKEAREVTR